MTEVQLETGGNNPLVNTADANPHMWAHLTSRPRILQAPRR